MAHKDIKEEFAIDFTKEVSSVQYQPKDIAYDISFGSIPFIINNSNQNPYRRETAQYKKDQFDSSTEPGEQSLTGWWLRSQTSFHNGAGIDYYEPGTDAAHTTHRFRDSRGIDVWTPGSATLLPDVFHSYTGSNGIVEDTMYDGTVECLVAGDSAGTLRRLRFNSNTSITGVSGYDTPYTLMSTGLSGGLHNSTYPFLSITTDGGRYFAVCGNSIHRGNTALGDSVFYQLGTGAKSSAVIKYTKGYLVYGSGQYLAQLDPEKSATTQHTGASDVPSGSGGNFINHLSSTWNWVSITGGSNVIYAAGRNKSKSEIWAIPYSDTTVNLSLPDAYTVAEMPTGELINAIHYYLGYLVIATNKGIRIAVVNQGGYQAGQIVYGPLLVETQYECTDIVVNDKYAWVSTSVKGTDNVPNGCLIRVDLSTPFDDGTFPYAYDLEYESDDPSYGVGVQYVDSRLHIIINEGSTAGEIQTQHTTDKRTTGWLQTGLIRYGTVQPKYFKYLDISGYIAPNDSITVQTYDSNYTIYDIAQITQNSITETIDLRNPVSKQEVLGLKFTFTNASSLAETPRLDSYQVKSIPAMARQRLIQYPLSCYDVEMDRYNTEFGYIGRSHDVLTSLEELENDGNFIQVVDYRTNETFKAVIEEIRFINESASNKNNSGYGGLLIVTVRKM